MATDCAAGWELAISTSAIAAAAPVTHIILVVCFIPRILSHGLPSATGPVRGVPFNRLQGVPFNRLHHTSSALPPASPQTTAA